jgi:hypothetical protein
LEGDRKGNHLVPKVERLKSELRDDIVGGVARGCTFQCQQLKGVATGKDKLFHVVLQLYPFVVRFFQLDIFFMKLKLVLVAFSLLYGKV